MSTIGQDAAARFTASAAKAIREAIDEVGGREVFFAGLLNETGLVHEVRICARGHGAAVPAYVEMADRADVVLHNHPSGDISPSEADLELSSLFGFHGLGVYIVDNAVSRAYVMVEPCREQATQPLDIPELEKALSPGSVLGRTLPHYEVRPQQARMMALVAQAFNEQGIAVIEAPTGIGKTIAYLLPAAQWAIRNRERLVISTRTINLQEQIMQKDIPDLLPALEKPVRAVLVKGRGNYVCPRRLERALAEATLFEDEEDQEQLKAIAEWARKTEDGTLSDLPFAPGRDIWEQVCSEADTCQFTTCTNLKRCFVGKARREIAKADLIVVNHHMLFADLAIKKEAGNFSSLAVLPAFRRVIFDEAHNIEDSATEYFGAEATRIGSLRLLGRFIRTERGRERGLLPFLKMKLIKHCSKLSMASIDAPLNLIDNLLLPCLAAARECLTVAFDALRELTAAKCGQIGADIKWRLTEEVLGDPSLRELHTTYVLPATEELRSCAEHAAQLHKQLLELDLREDDGESPIAGEVQQLAGYRDRLTRLANVLVEGTSRELPANTVRWVEIDGRNNRIVRIARCPLHVGPELSEWVYGNLKSVIMTSATLTVDHTFDYLFNRIGLDMVEPGNVTAEELDSPFDFASQAMLAIPTDIATPDSETFLLEVVDYVRSILHVTQGHAFVLFTSFYALDYVFRHLKDDLLSQGITPLKQGSIARTRLIERFRSDTSSVLFGTDSFWEGVDVAGEALQCVILPKLPFRVPTEPVLEARAEAIEAAGGSSFMQYTVPQAVVKFRQGFGRLIRRKTDRGAVIILDRRILTKHYGKVFLRSLPHLQLVKGPRNALLTSLEAFLGRSGVKS
ncbi:MAG TPA: helicase C-terminal domain-containing protein [Candidatus Hydrogenedentes bacterium]|nr:helicase C-terminal domain-containing protein [Candidatus Hydrogenedentota bacterium]